MATPRKGNAKRADAPPATRVSDVSDVCELLQVRCRVALLPYYASSDRVVSGIAALLADQLLR